jgi:hypothetical protein
MTTPVHDVSAPEIVAMLLNLWFPVLRRARLGGDFSIPEEGFPGNSGRGGLCTGF